MLRVAGDSMVPRYRAGEVVIVAPGRKFAPGDSVAVGLKNGRYLVKDLGWLRSYAAQLLSVNRSYPPITLSLEEIESIESIYGRIDSCPQSGEFVCRIANDWHEAAERADNGDGNTAAGQAVKGGAA